MKKLIALLLLTMMLSPMPVIAEVQTININNMTVEELQELSREVDNRLLELGAYYIDINSKSSGKQVINLQERLIELGYLSDEASGKWDLKTQKAMKAYEKASGLKTDGIATAAEQEVMFSESAISKPTAIPTKTPKPTATPNPYADYGKYNYKAIARNPEDYIGDKVKISGKVRQVLGSRSEGFTIRMATKGNYDNIVMLYISSDNAPSFNILEDDKLMVYGIVYDNYTYTSTQGLEITVPMVIVQTVELN